jgi:hypothetical protein
LPLPVPFTASSDARRTHGSEDAFGEGDAEQGLVVAVGQDDEADAAARDEGGGARGGSSRVTGLGLNTIASAWRTEKSSADTG